MLLITLAPAQTAHAYDFNPEEMAITYGHGTGVNSWLQLDMIQHITPPDFLADYFSEPYLDLGFATNTWKKTGARAYHLSANFMLRSDDMATPAGKVFAEMGFGPHFFSNPGSIDRLATAFEFNSFAGVGLRLSHQWAMILKARHLSNGGFTKGNAGVNLYLLQFNYAFDHKAF